MHDRGRMIGRVAELAALREALRADSSRTVVVSGPAGMGKSRLIAEIERETRASGAAVLHGGCLMIPGLEDVSTPYGPFSEALRSLDGVASAEQLARVREWLDADGRSPESALDPTEHRRAALLDLLSELAGHRPVVLVLEDLHWADPSSLGLLVFLVRNLGQRRVYLVVTSRPFPTGATEPAATVLEHLRRVLSVTWLDLAPLDDDQLAALVRDTATVSERRLADIVRMSVGHPLSAVELARAPADQRVPRSVAASVASRLASLAPVARATVEAAAVLGIDVRHDELAGTLAATSTATGVVDPADTNELLTATEDGYRFGHALDRDAVYSSLPPGRRLALHAAAAACLAALPSTAAPAARAERTARIAAHHAAAGDVDATVAASVTASRAAAAIAAYPEALAHAERALEAGPRASTGLPGYVTLALDAAQLARFAGRPERGATIVDLALTYPVEPREAALLWERLGWLRREIGEGDAAAAAYLQAIAQLDTFDDDAVAAAVHAGYAALLLTRFRLAEAGDEARAAVALAGDRPAATLAKALNTLGTVLAVTGRPDEGLDLLARSRDIALAARSEEDVWRYVGNATFVLQNLGRSAEALDLALAAHARGVRGGVSRSLAALPVITNAVSASVLLGRWDEALGMSDDALQGDPPPARAAHLRMYRAVVLLLRGDTDAAEAELATARTVGLGSGDPSVDVRAARVEAELHGSRHDFVRARAAADRGLQQLAGTDDPEMVADIVGAALRIEADAAQVNQRDHARLRALVARLDDAKTGLAPADVPDETRIGIALARAEAARAGGTDTVAMWAAIADDYAAMPSPHGAAYAQLRAAEAALAARDRRRAQREVQRGRELAIQLRTSRVGTMLDDLARSSRLDAAPQVRSTEAIDDGTGLTRREREVLALLVEGRSNRQISRSLGMSEKTASVHVSNLMAKLGVTSRTRAAAVATQRGIVLTP